MKTFKTLTESSGKDIDEMTDVQLCRRGMIEELKATTLYEDMATQAKDPRVKALLLDVAREEKIHQEEFEQMIAIVDPEWEDAHHEAKKEFKKKFGGKED